jgi:hypothetical protein
VLVAIPGIAVTAAVKVAKSTVLSRGSSPAATLPAKRRTARAVCGGRPLASRSAVATVSAAGKE